MSTPRIDRSDVGVLLIDVQPSFLDAAFAGRPKDREALLVRLEHLLMLAGWFDLPLTATFETPTSTNGELPDRLERLFPADRRRFVKDYFACTSEPGIAPAIEDMGVRQLAVAGAETDVCILQSTLGLLDIGYEVFLLEDCLFTTETRTGPALRRMVQAGAIPCTLKALAYELAGCVTDTPWYPEGWSLKEHPDTAPFPERFIPPEEWPPWNGSVW